MFTFGPVELESEPLACPGLLGETFLQLFLLLQELADLLVVAEGLAHELRLGDAGMFDLIGDHKNKEKYG